MFVYHASLKLCDRIFTIILHTRDWRVPAPKVAIYLGTFRCVDIRVVSIGHSLLIVQLHDPLSLLIKLALFAATEMIECVINIINK